MAIIKCKMCGGELVLAEDASTATCEYCGSVQTVPKVDDEKKLLQFERAEKLRKACEFDKAAGIYETIVADFREEAEAYWGLVLCKFGIEYVDDPATGKKVPTCHRSSFDSILDDSDFEQALENADVSARRVYRDEAKAIEEIRKGIIEVSSNEQPYDIFICYKETAEDGQRTLDSVLAQDVYDALTDKGYRVFFSRITLEDKLGVEYEPYIFAALNSAKVMLTFGTDYEYFNAVWVKNEWSRFLKLMAKDKEKHLIPCYKGIDAYDMPKEFAKLQAQDLGKVGAIQDLLRGIEKLLPRHQETTTVIQERIVVGGGGDNKIASLLDRGNMALEDGDWAKADSFFEDVLNNDSKNAQAYLGKTLAQEKCRTIDAFARKRKDASQSVRGQKLTLHPNESHISNKEKQYGIPGYVEPKAIRALYTFDLTYYSETAERLSQYRNEETYWATHKWLSKAEKFATGAMAEHLQREKKALFAVLNDRAKKAKAEETAAKVALEQRYEQHLQKADEKAEAMFEAGTKRREEHYQALLQAAKTACAVPLLTSTAESFEKLGNYQDSKNLAQHCRNRAAEEQAKLDKEAELRRIQAEKVAKERAAKLKKISIIAAIAAAIVAIFLVVLNNVIIPSQKYKEAEAFLASEDYDSAIEMFAAAGSFSDAEARHTQTVIDYAAQYMAKGEWEKAAQLYGKINLSSMLYRGKLMTSVLKRTPAETRVLIAASYYQVGLHSEALIVLSGIEENEDAGALLESVQGKLDEIRQQSLAAAYAEAAQLLQAGNFDDAITAFESLGDYQDSPQQVIAAQQAKEDHIFEQLIAEAKAFVEKAEYTSALEMSSTITNRGVKEERKSEFEEAVRDLLYQKASQLYTDKQYANSITVFELIPDYKDSTTQITACTNALLKHAKVGDTVTFGNYNNKAIQWTVLDTKGSKIMLFATASVGNKVYGENKNVTWLTSTIRKWLNNDFYNAAFNEEEKALIAKTTISNPNDPETKKGGCKDSTELVYLLSMQEADKYYENPGFKSEKFWTRTAGGPNFYKGTAICWAFKNYVYRLRPDTGEAIRPVIWIDTDKIN